MFGVKPELVDNDGKATGVDQTQITSIVGQLSNLGRDAVAPPLALDHAVAEAPDGTPLLLVRIPESPVKPAHRRGKSIEEAWVRSGGTTSMRSALMPTWMKSRASMETFRIGRRSGTRACA